MRKIFVIGCTHFGDSRILGYTGDDGELIRPGFRDVQDMDEKILDNWNSVVTNSDIVYHLGDVYFGKTDVLEKLNGKKRLVLGNHDNGKDKRLQSVFQKITMWRMFPELNVVLTHVPVIIPKKAKYDFNVHAHLHQNPSPTPYHVSASVEQTNFTPVDLEELLEKRKREIHQN